MIYRNPRPTRFRNCGEIDLRNLEDFFLGNPLETVISLDMDDRIT